MFEERATKIYLLSIIFFASFLLHSEKVFSHDASIEQCHADALSDRHHCHSNGQEISIPKYQRKHFGKWLDFDGDCQNTRHELLIELSTNALEFSENLCRVVRGRWLGPYSGDIFFESSELDIDHLVPLKFAWEHGAYEWDRKKRQDFANDEINLFAVEKSLNRKKGAAGPIEWLPPNEKFQCQYLLRFQRVLKNYEIDFFAKEKFRFDELKRMHCDL